MQCPSCGVENAGGTKFCIECGVPLQARCPRCESEHLPRAKFCGECGTPLPSLSLAAPPAALVPRSQPPVSYTPRHLAERILTSRAALEGERKPVTVLFCDLANSTTLAERLGPEAMHTLLNQFFELALAEVHRYEGAINQFLGDGFMALFGAPLAVEDHARRPLLAALGIQQGMHELRADVVPHAGVELAVRLGLNTGLVVVGRIGDNLRMDYTAVGDTTNLAARMQQMAPAGATWVAEATYRAAREAFEWRATGPLAVKGKAAPVSVYELLGQRAVTSRFEVLAQRGLTRFVGRYPYTLMGDYHQAVAPAQQSLASAEALEDFTLQVQGNFNLGMAYHGLGDYRRAIDLLRSNVVSLQGERLHGSFGTPGLLSVASRSVLVRCLTELGVFAEAIALGEEAVQIAEAVNNPDMLANACRSAPVPYLRKGDFPKAIPLLAHGIGLCQAGIGLRFFAELAAALGAAYALAGRTSESLPLLEQAMVPSVLRQAFQSAVPFLWVSWGVHQLRWHHACHPSSDVAARGAGAGRGDWGTCGAVRASTDCRRTIVMTSETRRDLLRVLDELSTQCPDVRFGQLIAHLATLAKGPTVEAIWDAGDEELLQGARQQLAIFRARHSAVTS